MDIRAEELETLHAIYGDSVEIDTREFIARTHIPLSFENEIPVTLACDAGPKRHSTITHAPPIEVSFTLPEKYPYEAPPQFDIACPVLGAETLEFLRSKLAQIWPELRDQVLFSMVDELRQYATENMEQLLGKEVSCGSNQILFEQVVAHDRAAKQKEFEAQTFTCEICQQSVKGKHCQRFDCGHTFCNACLRAFFVSLIENGDVEKVHCPDFGCSKGILQKREACLRLDHLQGATFNFEEFKASIMTPPIKLSLLSAVLGTNDAGCKMYTRYLEAYTDHQHVLIAKLFPMRLVSCPRTGCPAMIFRESLESRLVICRKCQYAFCNICRKSYHSSSIDCSKSNKDKQYYGISGEDLQAWLDEDKSSQRRLELRYKYGFELMNKVSNEYLMDRLFSELLREEAHDFSQCPTCDLIVQRSEGCNKMKCSSCHTSFCNLCDGFLDPDKPYDHYRNPENACYGKLFEGMPGVD